MIGYLDACGYTIKRRGDKIAIVSSRGTVLAKDMQEKNASPDCCMSLIDKIIHEARSGEPLE